MRDVISFGIGKEHYMEEGKTLCGLDLDEREFTAVAEVDLDNLCKRCYNASIETLDFESKVLEVSDVPLVEPVTGVKV
jgi:hypothetical protein